MKTRYHLVIFDWEGTLGDTLGHVLNALATQGLRMHFGEIDVNIARDYVPLGLVIAVKKLYPHLTLHQHEQLLHAVQESLATSCVETHLFPGVKTILTQIKNAGIDMAIATNKGQQSLQRVLQATNISEFIQVTRASGQTLPKPAPQMLFEIMDVFGVLAKNTLMIGDSVVDIEMAVSAGVNAIGMDFYHQQKKALLDAGALQVFDNYAAVAEFLGLSDSCGARSHS